MHNGHSAKGPEAQRTETAPNEAAASETAPDISAAPGAAPAAPGASAAAPDGQEPRNRSEGYVLIAIVYLLGLFIGALDMGIVSPARTVIQNSLGVEDSLGIWMLTIYTLAYAASIPVMGKLADRRGRKHVYLICVFLFGAGSLICGLSQAVGSFPMLLAGRVIQAVGGGGIMPVATAEFGTAFPPEKRGMALGLVGGVYGVASVFGASAGSLILDIFGATNWQFIFYVNVPICLVILVLGWLKLRNTAEDEVAPIDALGILIMTVMVLSLMYGLKNLDFFDIVGSVAGMDVAPFLVIFIVALPLFIAVEGRAADPVMNLGYFRNRDILITLVCSICTGIIMMASIFVPQFCENCLMMRSGSGGYFVIILGLFAGLGSPLSGTFIDRFGVKPVLGFGFVAAIAGALYLAFVACAHPNLPNVIVSLSLIGLGMGFTMGTPLNYMMLQKTDERESNSALATLSLVRSIGTAVAPAIMVAFVAHAGLAMQDNLMEALPTQVSVSPLPYAQELDEELDSLRANSATASMLDGVEIPKLSSYSTVDVSMEGNADGTAGIEMSAETLELLENSDVVTIPDTMKVMVDDMFGQLKPGLVADVQEGIASGMDAMREKRDALEAAASAAAGASAGGAAAGGAMADASAAAGMASTASSDAASAMTAAMGQMDAVLSKLQAVYDAVPALFDEAQENYKALIDQNAQVIRETYQRTLNEGFSGMFRFSACCSLLGLALVLLYRDERKKGADAGHGHGHGHRTGHGGTA